MSKSIYDIFASYAKLNPNKEAVCCENERISYAELQKMSLRLAGVLSGLGLKRGMHIGILLPNQIQWAAIMLAFSRLGLVLVPLATSTKASAISTQLSAVDASYCITSDARVKLLSDQLKGVKVIALSSLFNQSLQAADINSTDEPLLDAPYIITMTSGSTASPKPIIFSQHTKITRALLATKDVYGLGQNDRVLVSTPLYHSLAQRSLLLPLLIGGTAIILPNYDTKKWLECLQDERISFLFSVSSHLEKVAASKLASQYDLSALKHIISSSAPLSTPARVALLEQFSSAMVYEIYGTSEIGVATSLRIDERLGSVGRALSFVDVRIKNNEIQVKTKTAFLGYYKRPEASKEAYDDGYFKTGDLGRLDDDGYLYYLGRAKDIIITGGVNVLASDVEDAICSLAGVAECAVIGRDDERFGEAVVAFVVLDRDACLSQADILRHCLNLLNDYQLPKEIKILSALPKSGLGKILKGQLRQMI